jgi:hypothetical protein
MIKVALNGGLGNQLFQYAAGRALAEKHQSDLHFDVLPLYSKLQLQHIATYRRYELDIFSIDAKKNDVPLKGKYFYPLVKAEYYLSRELNRMRYNYFREKDFSFDAELLEQPDNTYLDGHFQSEKYFKQIESKIRQELKFRTPLTGSNQAWQTQIESRIGVSLHIRRGDYVNLQKNAAKHGATSLEYYRDAIRYINSKVGNAHFYIFTDDVPWVMENFKTDVPFDIVHGNASPRDAHFDMQLMSLCRHHIICNSTFSWWGAWLNPSPEKIVIAPEKWFADTSINSKDIYPPEWIKL